MVVESEEVCPIPNYPGYYISKAGRICRVKWLAEDNKNRRIVDLRNQDGDEWRQVGCLVAEVFIGPCPPGKELHHKDGDSTNDRLENLEWITHAENMQKHFFSKSTE